MDSMMHPLDKYLRIDRLPHLWCSGCGIGVALAAILRAIDRRIRENVLRKEEIAFISGIGCSARAPLYLNFDTAHTIHGRAIPFATGLKLTKPNMKVIVFGGDGDIVGIGGNHLIHAVRRNMDLIIFMINNMTYAMTGGQVAPTTPKGLYTTTTPYGNPEKPINAIKLVSIQGANYVARASITHPTLIEQYAYKALNKEGLSFIEIISTCPEVFGRHIGLRSATELYSEIRKKVKIKTNPTLDDSDYDWEKGFILGEYVDKDDPGFISQLSGVLKRAKI